MSSPDQTSAQASLDSARAMGVRARMATGWFANLLLVVAMWIVVWITAFGVAREAGGAIRWVTMAAGIGGALALRAWMRAHDAQPRARRRLIVLQIAMMAVFMGLYLPLVWLPGSAGVTTWLIIGLASAVPFVIGSWLERRTP